ncbi:MAG: HPr family phosphocarrier protein [Lysobacterales bacterium]|jgi:phosphocarrier protein
MVEHELVVSNRLGLHARAAAKLVQLSGRYTSKVSLICRGREVNAQSILGVMMLAAAKGVTVAVRAHGDDEEAALAAVIDLFERRFDEPD